MKKYIQNLENLMNSSVKEGHFQIWKGKPEDLVFEYTTKQHVKDLSKLCKNHCKAMGDAYGKIGSVLGAVTVPAVAFAYDLGVAMLRYGGANAIGRKARKPQYRRAFSH